MKAGNGECGLKTTYIINKQFPGNYASLFSGNISLIVMRENFPDR